LLATLLGGLALPFVGRCVDRHGARAGLPVVAVLLGFACLFLGQVTSAFGLFLGFAAIRSLGQGTLTLISTWLVGEWFVRRRGLAMGLVSIGGTLSVMTLPHVNDWAIQQFGWRGAWGLLGVVVWIVMVVPPYLLVRNRPEDVGQAPDGLLAATEAARATLDEKPDEVSWTLEEALRTAAFWKLCAVISVSALVGTGLVFHLVSLAAQHDVSRTTALTAISVQAFVGTLASIGAGYLTDRLPSRLLLAASMLLLALSVGLMIWMPRPELIFAYAALLGLHGGIMRSTGTAVWIEYFGRLHQGAVRGKALGVAIIAAALGPFPLAVANDWLGGYTPTLLLFAVMPLIAAAVVRGAHPPIPVAND
jgi:MFS family permease